jgi:hypothetical protein
MKIIYQNNDIQFISQKTGLTSYLFISPMDTYIFEDVVKAAFEINNKNNSSLSFYQEPDFKIFKFVKSDYDFTNYTTTKEDIVSISLYYQVENNDKENGKLNINNAWILNFDEVKLTEFNQSIIKFCDDILNDSSFTEGDFYPFDFKKGLELFAEFKESYQK